MSDTDNSSLVASMVKNPPANAGDAGFLGSIPESGRSTGEQNLICCGSWGHKESDMTNLLN